MPDYYRDEKGKVVGFTLNTSNTKTYFDNTGKVVSRIYDNRTYDSKGAFKGYGDQGLRVLGEKKKS